MGDIAIDIFINNAGVYGPRNSSFKHVDIETWIQEEQGQFIKTDKWGKRRFAYEINHKAEGHYVVLEMTTGQVDMEPLERMLRLSDEIVRHKLIRLPDHEAQKRGLI